MPRRKYKSTGCSRFFLVLLVLIPAAYFGARAINEGKGIPVVDDFIENIFTPKKEKATPIKTVDSTELINDLKKENQLLQDRIERLEAELEALNKNQTQ